MSGLPRRIKQQPTVRLETYDGRVILRRADDVSQEPYTDDWLETECGDYYNPLLNCLIAGDTLLSGGNRNERMGGHRALAAEGEGD